MKRSFTFAVCLAAGLVTNYYAFLLTILGIIATAQTAFPQALTLNDVAWLQSPSASGPFYPTNVTSATLIAWFQASSVSNADGTLISSWPDSSGGNPLLPRASYTKPYFTNNPAVLNGEGWLDFWTGDYGKMTRSTAAYAQPITQFFVVNPSPWAFTGTHVLISSTNAAQNCDFAFTTVERGLMDAGTPIYTSTGVAKSNSWRQVTAYFNGAASSYRTNGIVCTNANAGTSGMVGLNVGSAWAGGLSSAPRFAEIIIYTGAITTNDIVSVENYLKTRYGL